MRQRTIAKKVQSVGIGLHKGEPINISLEPLGSNEGIVFYRKDLAKSFKAEPKNVIDTKMATVIGDDEGFISTIEHLMSALNAYAIDNIRIVLDANEIPVMDGSSISYCMMLDEAGIQNLEAKKEIMVIKKPIEARDAKRFARLNPCKNLPKFDYTIDFAHKLIGMQSFSLEFSKENYIKEIARARTFGFLKDVNALRAMNLGLGGSLDNAVILDDDRILNKEGLRFKDEFVRHKILDAIGDLALLGKRVYADYEAYAGSHNLNFLLTSKLLQDSSNYELVSLSELKEYEKSFAL